jgi:D-alanine-D-alanine ligase
VEGPAGPEILPIAEITFVDFPENMPKVLGWEAKWAEGSFACDHTVRRFLTDPADEPLLARIRELVQETWWICGLSGYARVDLRLDEAGQPCILEVNANPCIAQGAGFEAAAIQAGLGPAALVQRILEAAVRRHSGCCTAKLSIPAAAPAPSRERPTVAGLTAAFLFRHSSSAGRAA